MCEVIQLLYSNDQYPLNGHMGTGSANGQMHMGMGSALVKKMAKLIFLYNDN